MKSQIFTFESLLVLAAIATFLGLLYYIQLNLIDVNEGESNLLLSSVKYLSLLQATASNPYIQNQIYAFDLHKINVSVLSKLLNQLSLYQVINGSFTPIISQSGKVLAEYYFLVGNFSFRNITNASLGKYVGLPGFAYAYKAQKCLAYYANGSLAPYLFVYNNTPAGLCTVYSVYNSPPLPFVIKGYNATGYYLGETEYVVVVPSILTINQK